MQTETNTSLEGPVTLIHHAANCDRQAPSNSLSSIKSCLSAGAAFVEIDVLPLSDGSFVLLHDPNLSEDTDGKGNAAQMTRGEVENLHYLYDGAVTNEKIGFLEGAVDLLTQFPNACRLQLDFKPFAPLTESALQNFLSIIKPVMDRVQVSSVADWALRALANAEPELPLGFDPLLYLDLVEETPRPKNIPPFRIGAYGLLDDHPLAAYQWGTMADYFAARAKALLVQAPQGCEWYIRAEVLKMALDAGFDWISFLHDHGSIVDAWTIDISQPDQIALAKFLVDHGIDELTTDQPSELAAKLNSDTIF
ncbi:MAG: Glycerophosphoryl diester phosphodiesterase [Anaerolineaceae bacterium 46_22]|nr:MAG: Glycerophosphoryl diester phosphodiesterase [Anaerolineaceae bacterium 46_22]